MPEQSPGALVGNRARRIAIGVVAAGIVGAWWSGAFAHGQQTNQACRETSPAAVCGPYSPGVETAEWAATGVFGAVAVASAAGAVLAGRVAQSPTGYQFDGGPAAEATAILIAAEAARREDGPDVSPDQLEGPAGDN
ncbi:MAG TPA: hypothetical protein VMB52_02350 [Verrucomicrobiae bacterium]|nr:hypothetical protein [Verrucomicrobiae bacterium]